MFNTHYQPHYHPTTKSLWLCSSVYCRPPHQSRRIWLVAAATNQKLWSPKTVSFMTTFHYSDVIWVPWPLKSPTTHCLFNRLFSRTSIKEHITVPHYWPFVRGIHRSPVGSPHKGPIARIIFSYHDVITRLSGSILVPRDWLSGIRLRASDGGLLAATAVTLRPTMRPRSNLGLATGYLATTEVIHRSSPWVLLVMALWLVLAAVVALLWLWYWRWSRSHARRLIDQLPSPPGRRPIFGHVLEIPLKPDGRSLWRLYRWVSARKT